MSTTTDLKGLQTESRNPKSTHIDNVSTIELCQIINDEDETIPNIVKCCIPTIAAAIDAVAPRVQRGGRIIYVGAGTSGRLGVLDASEIPPTYSAPPSQFVGLIAGGDLALRSAKEGAEDSLERAVNDLMVLDLDGEKDSLIGIASSGRTPYVLSSLAFVKSKGCITIGIACSAPSAMSRSGDVDFMIEAVTGPEVVTGSTRMKAGTATKLILNMLSSGIMIRIGKTFGNIMIDVKPTNVKLQIRARRILREICGDRCPETDEALDRELEACGRNVKLTAVKVYLGVSVEEAEHRLQDVGGMLASLLKASQGTNGASNGIGGKRKYVLCVDGGGSKCSAVVVSEDGTVCSGESGPCNPSDIGIQSAVSAIRLAIRNTLDSHDTTRGRDIRELFFADVWIGLAGGDRKAITGRVRGELVKFLGRDLSITNDIELLATASSYQFDSTDVIVLVAGTGSIAMRYRREGDACRRVARAGGWGALLGDDGSGFDIGRQAIRAVLRQMEEEVCSGGQDAEPLDPLASIICEHFRPTGADANDINLLSNVLLSASGDEQSASQTKQRIASCAKIVVDAIPNSRRAEAIVSDAIDSLAGSIRTVSQTAKLEGGTPLLVLAGGLIKSDLIQHRLINKLSLEDLMFSAIERVEEPAFIGAQFLAKKYWS